ncbi:MAG: proliferating cell nuclear antigen (pcna) [Nanoarchaeota archaeon]
MLVKLDNPVVLAKAVELISELVTEVRVNVNEFGLSITAMDPANVAMVGFKIPKSAFSQFEVGREILGVNLDSLKKVLRRTGVGSSLIIERKENLLELRIQDRIKRKFSLSLIDIEGEDIDFEAKISRMEFAVKVELPSEDLIDSVEDCSVVSDSCSLIVHEGNFVIESKGLNSARAEFSGDEAMIHGENCKSKYSLEYLSKFIKGAKLCERTLISFADDHPLKMDFKSAGMELSFVLAPRVETED